MPVKNAVLLIIPDAVRMTRTVNSLLENHTRSTRENVDCTVPQQKLINILSEQLCSGSLFSDKKIVILKNIDEVDSDTIKKIIKIIEESLTEDCFLVLCATSLAKNSILRKAVLKVGSIEELSPLEGIELRRWVEKEVASAGIKKYPKPLIDQLITSGESDPDKIYRCIERLSLYIEGESANIDDCKALFIENFSGNEYELLDSISQTNTAASRFSMIKHIKNGSNPFMLLGLISKSFLTSLAISSMQKRGTPQGEIRVKIGTASQWIFQKQFEATKRYNFERLRSGVKTLLRIDSRLKNRSLGAESLFDELTEKLNPRS